MSKSNTKEKPSKKAETASEEGNSKALTKEQNYAAAQKKSAAEIAKKKAALVKFRSETGRINKIQTLKAREIRLRAKLVDPDIRRLHGEFVSAQAENKALKKENAELKAALEAKK